MFKFTTTYLINSSKYIDSDITAFETGEAETGYKAGKKFVSIAKGPKFYEDDVVCMTKAEAVKAVKDKIEIDLSGLESLDEKQNYRIFLYTRSHANADPLYANDFVFKGRPLYIEWVSSGNETKDAARIKKNAKKYLNTLYDVEMVKVDAEGGVVTIDAVNEYQRFLSIEIQVYDPTASVTTADGAFVTIAKYDVTDQGEDTENDEDVFTFTQGRQGFGTYEHIMKDLRLPTGQNLRLYRTMADEMPIPGVLYNQFIVTQVTDRPEMQGTSVLGQVNKSRTTHVFYVADVTDSEGNNVSEAFQDALKTLVTDDNKFITVAEDGTEDEIQ